MSQCYRPPAPAASRTAAGLLVVWAALTLGLLAFVLHFGRNAPWADEWEMVPGLVGPEPVGPWLWRQHNEHRLPLPRLIWWGLFQLTHDFRAGMVGQVLLLSAAAVGLMRLTANLRGRPRWPDGFFAFGLLHPGHVENLVMGYQLCFVLTACGLLGLTAVAATTTNANRRRAAAWAGGIALLTELTGGSGLVVAGPAVMWGVYLLIGPSGLVGHAPRASSTGARRGTRSVPYKTALLLLALCVLYAAVYFVGYARPADHPPPNWSAPDRAARVAAQVLAESLGGGIWWMWQPAAGVVLLLVLGSTVALLRASRNPDRRPAALGLLAVLAGVVGLALAVGVGRSGFERDNMGLWSRYAVLTWPALAVVYLTAGERVRMGLCLLAVGMFAVNVEFGLTWAGGPDGSAEILDRMEADIRSGLPPAEVVARNHYLVQTGRREQIADGMRLLKHAGFSYFREANVP